MKYKTILLILTLVLLVSCTGTILDTDCEWHGNYSQIGYDCCKSCQAENATRFNYFYNDTIVACTCGTT